MKKYNYDVFNKFAKYFKKGFKPNTTPKLNPSEVELLVAVKRQPNMPMFFYGRVIKLEKSSMSYLMDLLEVKKLVMKLENPEDKRRKSLVLTETGEKMVLELKKQHGAFVKERLEIFTEEEKIKLNTAYGILLDLDKKLEINVQKKRPDLDGPDGRFKPRISRPDRF